MRNVANVRTVSTSPKKDENVKKSNRINGRNKPFEIYSYEKLEALDNLKSLIENGNIPAKLVDAKGKKELLDNIEKSRNFIWQRIVMHFSAINIDSK